MLNLYLLVSSLSSAFMFCIWSKDDWINILVKMFFLVTTVSGIVFLLMRLGYLVKI